MKYCLKWNNRCINLKNADEISIRYIEDKGLLDFMKKYADKRIIIRLESSAFGDSEINKLIAIKKQFPEYQFTVAIPDNSLSLALKLKCDNIPFYFLKPVQDWETLNNYIINLEVSDIDLSGALAFELPKVKRFLEKVNSKTLIRITPNIINSISPNCNPLQKFFIRPDDIDIYAPYIDILEFEGIEHQDTFYKIYVKEKLFIGKLNQVIYNFPLAIDNMGLISYFGERRLNCGRQCLWGGRCRTCENLTSLSEKMGPQVRKSIKEKLQKQIQDKSNEK